MNYPNIKKHKLSHKEIAMLFGYKNVAAFRCSSAHKRIMTAVDKLLERKELT